MPLSKDELLRKAAAFGGGLIARPIIWHVPIREREVVQVGAPGRDRVVYIPQLPEPRLDLAPAPDPSDPSDLSDLTHFGPTIEQFISEECGYSVWITTETTMDTSDPLRPRILLKGYERIYHWRVWMTTKEYDKRHTFLDGGEEDGEEEVEDEDDAAEA